MLKSHLHLPVSHNMSDRIVKDSYIKIIVILDFMFVNK